MKTRPYIELRRESIARAAIGNKRRRVDNPPPVYNLPHIFQG